MRTTLRWAGVAAVTSALGYALPFITAFPQVLRWMPRLAGRGQPGHVALTFDDGPDPYGTPEILDILAQLEVAATFFVLGEQVAKHPTSRSAWSRRAMRLLFTGGITATAS